MRIALLFLKWIACKIIGQFGELHSDLRRGLPRNTWETIFFWFITTLVFSVVNLLIMAGISSLFDLHLNAWWIFWLPLTMFIHLLYTGVSVMFSCFKQERAEIFEIIKNSK